MKRLACAIALAAAGGGASLLACGSGDDNGVAAPAVDAGPIDATRSDATADDAAVKDAAVVPMAYVRIAQWSKLAPAIDLCLAPAGSNAFHGPLLSTVFASPLDGAVLGIPFPQASAYMPTPAGSFDVRLVPAGSADCSSGIGADSAGVVLAANSFSTFAVLPLAADAGAAAGRAGTLVLGDDPIAPQGQVALRFIDGDPSDGPLILTTDASGPLLQGVKFGSVPTSANAVTGAMGPSGPIPSVSVDLRGYAALAPITSTIIHAGVPVSTTTQTMDDAGNVTSVTTTTLVDVATASSFTFAAGSVVTLVLAPTQPGTAAFDAGIPLQFVACIDNAGTVNSFGNCSSGSH
jgi:hypothetical protein